MKRLMSTALLAVTLAVGYTNVAAAQEPYVGEIRLFGYNWCPVGWFQAAGQLLPISQYTALFSLYGTNFGGNGQTNFGLPNLSGRAPVGQASGGFGQPFAAVYGQSTTTLLTSQMPMHTHMFMASSATNGTNDPTNALFPTFGSTQHIYAVAGSPANKVMAANSIGTAGGSQPFSTQSPSLSLNWCVAYQGIFPSRP